MNAQLYLPILNHLRAVRDNIAREGLAKEQASNNTNAADSERAWREGYACAMKDAVKALNSLLQEYQ